MISSRGFDRLGEMTWIV